MRLNFVPLVVALLPFTAIHVCYLIAAYMGHVPWCNPYLESCTSISATGRQSPEAHLFRATIIPSAILMMVYWVLVQAWLKTLTDRMVIARRVMLGFGLVASLGLIIYATVLGEIGSGYTLQRRIGVRLFYGLTVLAQLLMAIQIRAIAHADPGQKLLVPARMLLSISGLTFLIGLVSLVLWATYAKFDDIEQAFAWWLSLLVFLHPMIIFFVWRESGFEARFVLSRR